ncbi:MAG: hypothetical protein AAF561_08350 [Planctomycetota bacterium]
MTLSATPSGLEAGRLVRSAGQRLALARVAVFVLAGLVLLSLFVPQLLGKDRMGDVVGFAGLAAAAVWVLLGFNAARQGRRVREAAALATLGRSDLAEQRALATLEGFCLLRPVTLGAAVVLARVRQTQGRHAEAARLAAFVLSRRERTLTGGKRTIRLLLGESLLAAGDPSGASTAIRPLYSPSGDKDQQLDLDEALRLLSLQIRLDAAAEQWQSLYNALPTSMPMVELLPSGVQADLLRELARASQACGDESWATYLERRASLLTTKEST